MHGKFLRRQLNNLQQSTEKLTKTCGDVLHITVWVGKLQAVLLNNSYFIKRSSHFLILHETSLSTRSLALVAGPRSVRNFTDDQLKHTGQVGGGHCMHAIRSIFDKVE